MEPSDEELIEAYINGQEEAFAVLVRRYISYVYSFSVRLVQDESEAEDITQETFLKVWKHIKKYSKESARFKTWLTRILRNTAIDFLRKKRPVLFSAFDTEEGGNVLFDQLADTTPLADEVFLKTEETEALAGAISKLAPLYREVVLLYHGNDLSLEEVGDILGVPANTAKSRYRRAVHQLEALLAPKPQ
jgi:RNA polymerase sigma-70 factor (ECF subfamily)